MISLIATGDCFITRLLPKNKPLSFKNVSQLISRAEVRFTNFEMTTPGPLAFPSAISGGTWAKAAPDVVQVIYDYGFNIINWANNHTLDYLYQGIEDTKRNLAEYGFVEAGVGNNLAEASCPKYLECPSGRVALIAAVSSCPAFWVAGEQRPDMIGRPGVNPLRFSTTYVLPDKELSVLKEIAKKTYINADKDLAIKEGFSIAEEDGVFTFGGHSFIKGTEAGIITEPLEKDMKRIIKSIDEAKQMADCVLVSIHSHEMAKGRKELPAEFLITFARKCIDAGADAVIGHGPHILRGIEIYRNRPIFYSLGNFIFQSDTVTQLPADFYEKYGLDFYNNVTDALNKRSANNKGLGVNPDVWMSVIPYWEMDNNGLSKLELHPIDLGFHLPRYKKGWPMLTESSESLYKLKELSRPFGTEIEIDGSIGQVKL